MLNKKEKSQLDDFLTTITDLCRSMLDEIAMYYAELDNNKSEQRKQSELRKLRKKRQRSKQKSRN